MTEPRTPKLSPADMTPRQRELYDAFTTGPRANPDQPFRLYDEDGHLTGPPSTWILNPEIGLALERFGGQMRWGIHTSGATREAVILAVAYAERSDFEVFAHEPAGRSEGLSDEDFAVLREGRVPDNASDETRIAHALALELIRTREVSDETWARASEVLGLAVVFEIVTLVGYYQLVALTLSAFQIRPPGAE